MDYLIDDDLSIDDISPFYEAYSSKIKIHAPDKEQLIPNFCFSTVTEDDFLLFKKYIGCMQPDFFPPVIIQMYFRVRELLFSPDQYMKGKRVHPLMSIQLSGVVWDFNRFMLSFFPELVIECPSADAEENVEEPVQETVVENLAPIVYDGSFSTQKCGGEETFSFEDRSYLFKGKGPVAYASIEAQRDYVGWLLDNPPSSELISEQSYDDPMLYNKVVSYRLHQAFNLVEPLPLHNRLVIPGDGLGLFSYACRSLGRRCLSSEPNAVGEIAVNLGLIDFREQVFKTLRRLKPGDLIILSNLELYVDIDKVMKFAAGYPILYFDQQRIQRDGFLEVPFTSGRVMVNFPYELNSKFLDYNHRHCYEWLERKGSNRAKLGPFFLVGTTPYSCYVARDFNKTFSKVFGQGVAVPLGKMEGELNVITRQDFQEPNLKNGLPFVFGKYGDFVTIHKRSVPWGEKMIHTTPKSFIQVSGLRRERVDIEISSVLGRGLNVIFLDKKPPPKIRTMRFLHTTYFVKVFSRQKVGTQWRVLVSVFMTRHDKDIDK